MKYAQMRKYDIANGKGIGCTLFVSGCRHNCPHCFNKEYQDFEYGQLWNREVEQRFLEMCDNPRVDHISILGGEPFQQDVTTLLNLLKRIKERTNKTIWLWTGYKWGEWEYMYNYCLQYIDVLVDGRYVESQKDLSLYYRGSRNQRVIDVKQTLSKGEITLYCE